MPLKQLHSALHFIGECDSGMEHETFSILTKRERLMYSECWHWNVEFFSVNIICGILAHGSLIIEFLHQIGLLRKNVPELDRAHENQPIELDAMRQNFQEEVLQLGLFLLSSSVVYAPSNRNQMTSPGCLQPLRVGNKKCRLIQKKLSSLQSAISIQCTLPFPLNLIICPSF